MPDARDFGQGSNDQGPYDRGAYDQDTHTAWAGAFAALPQETPAADGWQRLQARLPQAPTRQRTRWPLWLASAASLALVVAIPLRMQSTTTTTNTTTTTTSNEPPVITPSPKPITTQSVIDADVAVASIDIVPSPIKDTSTAAPTPLPTSATTARVRKPRRDRHLDPSLRPIRTAAQPADTTLIAGAKTPEPPASNIDLESLYAQSAQLEGLLLLARDDRVSTGTAAALTDTLNGQMAGIDAALTEPETSEQNRNELWRNRVNTLRQLVGIETTQRLYSARGQQYEADLVSID